MGEKTDRAQLAARQKEALRQAASAWKDEDHPELQELPSIITGLISWR